MRTATRMTGGLALVMALAGCNWDSVTEQLPGQAPATTVEGSRSDPATPVPGEPDPAASKSPNSGDGSQLGPEQLEAVLAAVNEAESLNAQVIPDADLRALEAESARRAEGIVVTPEECNVYAEPSPEPPTADAVRAAMTFAGESSLQPDTVSLSSLPSEETAIEQMQANRNQLERCSEFTMELSGEKIMMTVAEIQVDTAADKDLALRTTAQVPGTIQRALTVSAVVGSTVVDVLVGSSTDPEADAARAEHLVDLVVAELRLL